MADSIYGKYATSGKLSPDAQQGIVASLTVILFVCMAMEKFTPEVLFMAALVVITFCEILTLEEALSGFSNNAVITIGTLFLVVNVVEKSHVLDWIARKSFGTVGSVTFAKCRIFISCFVLSMFFNNTPLVAVLLPIVKDWARMRGLPASHLLMPLSYAVLSGSFGSMIGTSTNLTIQGLMQKDRGYSFSFFAPLPYGVCLFVVLLGYLVLAAEHILPNDKSGLIREVRDRAENLVAEVYVSGGSSCVGKSLGDMAGSLGLSASSVIKIRRRISPYITSPPPSSDDLQNLAEGEESRTRPRRKSHGRGLDFVDKNYKKFASHFWTPSKQRGENKEGEIKTETHDETVDPQGVELSESPGYKGELVDVESNPNYRDIVAPEFHEIVAGGDIIFISSAQVVVEKMLKSIMGESDGLKILTSDVFALPGFGTEIVECVVSNTNPYLGEQISSLSEPFSKKYKLGLITVRSNQTGAKRGRTKSSDTATGDGVISFPKIDSFRGRHVFSRLDSSKSPSKDSETSQKQTEIELDLNQSEKISGEDIEVSGNTLDTGDVILAVTSKNNLEDLSKNKDFYVTSCVGGLPMPLTIYSLVPLILFFIMLLFVGLEMVDICPAALLLSSIFFLGGWIKPNEIPFVVDIRLLVLLGASISYAQSMSKSGLAHRIASGITGADPSPIQALILVYGMTLGMTEFVSNNAAASLMYPIATNVADELGLSFKPFVMATLIASTSGFMSPIAYQTHLMVWGPGGYKFADFIKFGFFPDVLFWFLSCGLITLLMEF